MPTRGLAFETSAFEERAAILDSWVEQQAGALTRPFPGAAQAQETAPAAEGGRA